MDGAASWPRAMLGLAIQRAGDPDVSHSDSLRDAFEAEEDHADVRRASSDVSGMARPAAMKRAMQKSWHSLRSKVIPPRCRQIVPVSKVGSHSGGVPPRVPADGRDCQAAEFSPHRCSTCGTASTCASGPTSAAASRLSGAGTPASRASSGSRHFPDDSWSAGYQGSPRTCPDETVSTSSSSRRHPCRCSTPTPGPHAGCICQAAEAHARLGGLGARAPARGHPRQPLPEIFALYSSPMGQDALNVHKEVRVIHDALDQSGSGVRLRVGAATLESLTSLLTLARSGTRRGLALHLSAHAHKDETRGVGLMLEDEFGVGHLYYRDQLEELLGHRNQGLKNVSLLFLSACYSEELAEVFVECGCRHVVSLHTGVSDATARRFAKQFYLSLGVGDSLLVAWQGARATLKNESDPNFRLQAEHFVLYGQQGADRATLLSLCGAEDVFGGGPALPGANLEEAKVCLDHGPGDEVEHFVGRTDQMTEIFGMLIKTSRAVVLHGPEGIGKAALAVTLASFASSPGRFFSCAARVVVVKDESLGSILESIEEEVEALAALLGAASPGESSRSSLSSTPRSSAARSSWPPTYPEPEGPGHVLLACQRIRRGIRRIEKARGERPCLLVLVDKVGAISGSLETQRILGDLLDNTRELRLLLCSQDPVYNSLGAIKVRNYPLGGLEGPHAAKLFMYRAHRLILPNDFPADLTQGRRPSSLEEWNAMLERNPATPKSPGLLELHPLLESLKGNPERIRAMASRVVPNGPTLLELGAATEAPEVEPVTPLRRGAAVSTTPSTGRSWALATP